MCAEHLDNYRRLKLVNLYRFGSSSFSLTNEQITELIDRYARVSLADKIVLSKQAHDFITVRFGDASTTTQDLIMLEGEIEELNTYLTVFGKVCSNEERSLADIKGHLAFKKVTRLAYLWRIKTINASIRTMNARIAGVEQVLEHINASLDILNAKKEAIALLRTMPLSVVAL
jgi:hypothetical protein